MKTAIMVHDLIAFLPDAHDRRARRIERMTLPLALKKAAHVFALSDSTKHDLLARFSDIIARDVPVLWAGPSRDSPLPRSDDGKSIVCIATLCPRKNQLRLIQAYAALPERLRSQHSLVLAGGRGWDDKDILRAVESTPGVQWLSYVSQEQYARLIADCHLFAWPTLYEGFGIPVLDAFQAGAPVLTSNAPGVRDVAADAALLVDPLSAPSITAGMERLLTDDALRAELAERGKRRAQEFSWQKTTELFLGALPPVLP
jgi:alpha-1,3-rhamnosyl/mannosyltransferase